MKQRILVVDDEPQIREMLSMYFDRHGYETASAANSRETLRAVAETSVDVVVLDIGLAEEDGLKLLEQLKAWRLAEANGRQEKGAFLRLASA